MPLQIRVVFRPGGAYPFFGAPVDALADRMVPLVDLWGADGARVLDRLVVGAERGGDVAEIVRDALVARLRAAPFEPPSAVAARAAVAQLVEGERSIDAVARNVGLSARHLRRAFLATVGVGPRTFARIVRFQRALALGRAAPGRWSDVALATGYCDQAHLTAEFRKLALVSPGSLDSLDTAVARLRLVCGSAAAEPSPAGFDGKLVRVAKENASALKLKTAELEED